MTATEAIAKEINFGQKNMNKTMSLIKKKDLHTEMAFAALHLELGWQPFRRTPFSFEVHSVKPEDMMRFQRIVNEEFPIDVDVFECRRIPRTTTSDSPDSVKYQVIVFPLGRRSEAA